MKKTGNLITRGFATVLLLWSTMLSAAEPMQPAGAQMDYDRAKWNPIHFKPLIDTAKDEECLACHKEVLEPSVKAESPAGVKSQDALAWYQTLNPYQGDQDTFHRRHISTPLAKELMNLQCNFCHQGNDPREEAVMPPTAEKAGFTLRKMVDPTETCLKCHGKHNSEVMGLPKPTWEESRDMVGGGCMNCHAAIRTVRHQVTYLKPEAIEAAGKKDTDVCFGCHGGRKWYRISYPYPRHPWPGAAAKVPDWAKDRPTESEPRFRLPQQTTSATPAPASMATEAKN